MSRLLCRAALLLSFVLLSCGEKLTEEQLYDKARDFEANADYAQAEATYKKLLADYPQSAKAQEVTAKVELLGKTGTLTQEELLSQFQVYEASENLENLILLYNSFLKRFPEYAKRDEVLQKLAWSYHNRKDFQRSITTYQQLLTETPKSEHAPQSQFMIGYIYANELKDLERARVAYEAFQKNFPQHDLSDDVAFELEHLGKDINDLNFLSKPLDEPATLNTNSATDSKSRARAAKQ